VVVVLTPNEQFFEALSWREQVALCYNNDEVCFGLDRHAMLDFYSASSLKQQSAGRHVTPLGHIPWFQANQFALTP